MEVHLIRHGETDWNRERRVQGQSDSRLNDAGEQQARELAARIEHIRFDAIFCSSSLRTRQTAAALFSDRLDHIQYLDTLREIYLGPWEGSLYDEIESHSPDSFRHFWQEPHLFAVAGAENFYQLQTRAMDALRELQQQHHGKRVAVVSHGALIKTVLAHAQCLPMEKLWTPPHLHNCAHNIISFAADGSSRVLQIADRWIGEQPPG